jgi:PST family polysaccharide transporter
VTRDLEARANRSAAWVGAASLVLGILDVVSTVVILRLWVSAEEFGTATIAIALLPIVDRLGGTGVAGVLVRDGEPDDVQLATVAWLALAIAGATALVLVGARAIVAPLLAEPVIASLVAAYGARVVLASAGAVPEALMRRDLRYAELSIIRVLASAIEIATKLSLAYAGAHGAPALRVWCFALGPIANSLATTIALQLRRPYRPRALFSRAIAARAARFWISVSGGELLYYAYTSADYVVVGAWFGDAAVGAYRLAYELVLDVVRLVSMVTAEVAFPTFARLARDPAALAAQVVRFSRQNLVALAPFLALVAIEADDLLALLYPPLPPEAATAARILCAVGALRALGFTLPPLLAGVGRPSRVLVYNAIAAIVLPVLFVTAAALAPERGFVAVAWAWALGYPIAFAALVAMALPAGGVSFGAYARGLAPIAACAAGALVAGLVARALVDAGPGARVVAVAAAIVVVDTALLARIAGITPRRIARGFRGVV